MRRQGSFAPAPDPVRTIFLDKPPIDFRPSYNELLALVSSHPETICSRWCKKSLALRSKCLARAWADTTRGKKILQRRPRLSEKLLGDPKTGTQQDPLKQLDMEEFLYACINVEQLANNPANLLNLIYSRSAKHPSHFGRSDYNNFVKPVLELFKLIDSGQRKKGNADVVMIQADESDYGTVKTWNRQSEDYHQRIYKMLVCNVDCEGTWLMKWQKTIINFCLSCVKDILGPSDLQKPTTTLFGGVEKLLQGVQNYSLPTAAAESRSATLLTLPYIIPKEFSLRNAHTRALTHLRAAEDHVNFLRSDPNYLLSQVELRLAHRAEHIPDMHDRTGNAESSESVQDAVAKLIHNGYSEALVWNEICILFEDAVHLMSGKQGSWWSSSSNPVLDEKIKSIDALLGICEDFSETTIYMHASAGPSLRHRFFRAETISFTGEMSIASVPGDTPSSVYMENPIDGLLMCMCLKGSGLWEPEIFNLKIVADEIEHIVATNRPELKSHIHPWLMNILSDVAAAEEIRENIARHVPCREQASLSEACVADVLMGISMNINEFAQVWPEVNLSAFLGKDQIGWQRLRKVADGNGLERFWRLVDAQVLKLSRGKSLEGWIGGNKGRLAKRRKGRWMWQGRVWLAEGAVLEEERAIVDVGEEKELPGLVAVVGFDDSRGYGEGPVLSDVFETETVQPKAPAVPLLQAVVQSREKRKISIPKAAQTRTDKENKPPTAKSQPALVLERPFGVNASGSRGAEPKLTPLPKEKQKTRPATTTRDIEGKLDNIDPNQPQEKPIIYVSKRVYQAITHLSSGIPLAWKEFVHLMVSLGFAVRPVGGSVVRFVPEDEEDEPINLHRPHPDAVLAKDECFWIWKRLKRNYGWEAGIFEREKAGEGKV